MSFDAVRRKFDDQTSDDAAFMDKFDATMDEILARAGFPRSGEHTPRTRPPVRTGVAGVSPVPRNDENETVDAEAVASEADVAVDTAGDDATDVTDAVDVGDVPQETDAGGTADDDMTNAEATTEVPAVVQQQPARRPAAAKPVSPSAQATMRMVWQVVLMRVGVVDVSGAAAMIDTYIQQQRGGVMAHRDWRTFGNKTTASRVSRVVEAYSELSLVERAAVNQQLGLAEAAVIDELQSAIEEAAEVLTRPPYEVAEAERAAIREEVLRELGGAGADGVPDTVPQVTSAGEYDVAHLDASGAGQGETHGSIVAAPEDNDSVTITTDSAGDDGAAAHEGDNAGSHSATRPSAEPTGEPAAPAAADDDARAAGNRADAPDHAGDGDASDSADVADAAADADGHGDRGLDVPERGNRERSGSGEAGAQDASRPSADNAGVTATSMSVAQAAPAGGGVRGRTKFMDAAQRASRAARPSDVAAEADAGATGAGVATDADTDSSVTTSASPFDAPVESMTYDDADEDAVAPARFDGGEDYEFDDDFEGDEFDDEDPEFAGYEPADFPDGEDEIDVPDEAVVRE